MKDTNYFKVIKTWLISIFSFDVLMLLYLFIMGRVLEIEILLPNLITVVAFIVIGLSVLVGLAAIIYAIVKKQYAYIMHGIGIILSSFILYFVVLIIALSQIF